MTLAVAAFVIGAIAGAWFAAASYARTIRYKAETKIDMNINGMFYEIRFSERNKTEDGDVK